MFNNINKKGVYISDVAHPKNDKNQKHGYVKHIWCGHLLLEGNYTNGKRDGVFIDYYWNGNPYRVVRYTLGKKHPYYIEYDKHKIKKCFHI
jgi:antitoxin component YwqK of YwqJK toxin-antitoxin module